MNSRLFKDNIVQFVVVLFVSTNAFGQNIIKDPLPTVTSGIAGLSAKLNDLKPDGSHYGLGYNYYGSPVPAPGLAYGQSIVASPYAAKPYFSPAIGNGYYPQGFAVGAKPVPYNGYIQPGYGYSTNFGFNSGVGLGYPGVLGYNNGYDQQAVLPPNGYNGLYTGYVG